MEIYYNRSVDNGETWGITNKRLTDDLAYSGCPSIAVCDSIVHVVWWDWRDSNYEIYYNRSVDNGETWGIDNRRLTTNSAYSGDPSIAVCDSAVHVVWVDERDSDYEIYYNRSVNDGETWGTDEMLTNSVGKSERVSVACWNCDYDYDVHIAWTDWRHGASNSEIYYKRHKCENTNVEESEELKVKSLELRVFPNPCSKKIVIRYSLNENRNGYTINDLQLTIHDISGKLVKTILTTNYDVEINLEELTNGIYFVKMATGDFKATKKIVLMR